MSNLSDSEQLQSGQGVEENSRYVQVYTGEGKGKTTASIGLTVRAIGAGWRVLFSQFLKSGDYSEIKTLKTLSPQLEVVQFGSGRFVRGKPTEEEILQAREGLDFLEHKMVSGQYDLMILDEINVALHFNVITLERVLAFLDKRPSSVELVLTGRWAPDEILKQADLVTEMLPVKHYFKKGVRSRTGIEK